MNQQRRSVLKYSAVFGLMASTGLISTAQAQEWNKAAFEGKGIDDVFKILSSGTPDKSKNSHKTKETNKKLKGLHG
jgi:sulfur-oxidizing protein SoxY